MNYKLSLLLFLAMISSPLVAQENLKRESISLFNEKPLIKVEANNKDIFYHKDSISRSTVDIVLKSLPLKNMTSGLLFGVQNRKDIYMAFVELANSPDDTIGTRIYFIKIEAGKATVIYKSKGLMDSAISHITYFMGNDVTLIAIQLMSTGEAELWEPFLFSVTDNAVTKMAKIPYTSTCRQQPCSEEREELFKKASATYNDGAYYVSIYGNLISVNNGDDPKELALEGKRRFVFKLTAKAFTRVKEYE